MNKDEFRFGALLMIAMIALMQMKCVPEEHAEDVCLRMSQEDYDRINEKLGGDHNTIAIAEYYEAHSRK